MTQAASTCPKRGRIGRNLGNRTENNALRLVSLCFLSVLVGSVSLARAEPAPVDKKQALHQSHQAHLALQQTLMRQLAAVHKREDQLRRASGNAEQAEKQLHLLHIRQENIERALARTQESLNQVEAQQDHIQQEEARLARQRVQHALEIALLLPAAQQMDSLEIGNAVTSRNIGDGHDGADISLLWPPPLFRNASQNALSSAPDISETAVELSLLRAQAILTRQEELRLEERAKAIALQKQALTQKKERLKQQKQQEQQGQTENQNLAQKAKEAHNRAQESLEDAKAMLAEARQNSSALNEEIAHLAFQERETRRQITKKIRSLGKTSNAQEADHLAREAITINTGKGISRGHGAPPVQNGVLFTHWREPTDAGPATGLTYKAGTNAEIYAPCTGKLLFSGHFRSFGQMIILDCGHYQRFVLAGFGKITTPVSDVVHNGEILGTMPGAGGFLFVQLHRKNRLLDPTPYLETPGDKHASVPGHHFTRKEAKDPIPPKHEKQ